MPEDSRTIADGCEYMLNRELSWLKFNGRVLAEAEDKTVPVLEIFHFLSIFTYTCCTLSEPGQNGGP